jgi:phosphopantothenoylcysteine decarboxylase
MAKILLGVTGSVAAIRAPALAAQLRAAGHQLKLVATKAALYFFDPAQLKEAEREKGKIGEKKDADSTFPFSRSWFFRDEDEWPDRDSGRLYQRDDPVLHIELRRWADLFLIAPLDANTLAKLANGLADNCLMCVWRAWDVNRPVLLAPAMNTLMWEHPLTDRHLRQLAADAQTDPVPTDLACEDLLIWINDHCPRLHIVPPISKRLACGDVGVGAMAAVEEIVAAVQSCLMNVDGGRQ